VSDQLVPSPSTMKRHPPSSTKTSVPGNDGYAPAKNLFRDADHRAAEWPIQTTVKTRPGLLKSHIYATRPTLGHEYTKVGPGHAPRHRLCV